MLRLPALTALGNVLDHALRVDDAVGGCVQVAEEVDGERVIRVVIERGLEPDYFERYRVLRPSHPSSYAQAFAERRRVVIRDVRTDPAREALCEVAERAGYRSVQTTPLIDDRDRFHGLFSTYFRDAHHPGPAAMAELDRCARVMTLVLQARELYDEVESADAQLRIHDRLLPPHAVSAAEHATRLIERPGLHLDEISHALGEVVVALRAISRRRAPQGTDRRARDR